MSLRNCLITDQWAEGIGHSLGTPKKANTKLLSLNLAGNRITDIGGEHIARVRLYLAAVVHRLY